MGQACSPELCCTGDGAVDYALPPSTPAVATLQDEAYIAPKARYPTLLRSGCSGDASSPAAMRSVLDKGCGKELPGRPHGDAAIRGGDGRAAEGAVEADLPRLSARSAGYLESEANEVLKVKAKGDGVRDWVPYTFDSGAVYTGEWNGGMRHGHGRQVWPDGAVYEGHWKENCASGNGRFVHKDGDQFIGQWRDNVASGLGSYYHKAQELKIQIIGVRGAPSTDPYCICEVVGKPESRFQTEAPGPGADGEWEHEASVAYAIGDSLSFTVRGRSGRKEDDLLGRARLSSEAFHPSGFDGEVPLRTRRGIKANLRVRVAAVRGAYWGEWASDCQNGFGVETWSEGWQEGARYAGQFADGLKHGSGTYRWADGSVYEGQWVGNAIQGEGTYVATDGRCFKGQWRDSLIHGLGQYLWPGGRWYSGHYVFDQKHGFGTFHWPDGRRYEGFWANGKQDGLGRLTTKSGKTRLSLWERGRRTSDVGEEA